MPNVITHLEYAKMVYDKLDSQLQSIIDDNKDAFLLGAIGPDILFALREVGDKANASYANTLQYIAQAELFENLRQHLAVNENAVRLSYVLGFLCHYVADKNMHAYVNYFHENYTPKDLTWQESNSTHTLIESALDTYVLTEIRGLLCPNTYKPEKEMKQRKSTKREIGKLYEEVINKMYGYAMNEKKFALSVDITSLFMWFTTDKKGRKFKFANKIEEKHLSNKKLTCLLRPAVKYGEVDYLNFNKLPWRKVRNEEEMTDKTMIDVLNESIEEASQDYLPYFYASVLHNTPLDKDKFSVNFEGIRTQV